MKYYDTTNGCVTSYDVDTLNIYILTESITLLVKFIHKQNTNHSLSTLLLLSFCKSLN